MSMGGLRARRYILQVVPILDIACRVSILAMTECVFTVPCGDTVSSRYV